MLPRFCLEVYILAGDESAFDQSEIWAQQIISISAELYIKHGVTVHVTLQSSAGSTASPAILRTLAPLLHSVNLIPRQRRSNSLLSAAVTLAHTAALQHSSTLLDTLYISDSAAHSDPPALPTAGSIADVAQLSNLTKLHLSLLNAGEQDINFQSLSQLSLLQDLTLQSSRTVCCACVLHSSRQSLCHISLTATRWSRATYEALQEMPYLETLVIKLGRSMCVVQARAIAKVTAKHFHLELR